jgi:hypothetical protein
MPIRQAKKSTHPCSSRLPSVRHRRSLSRLPSVRYRRYLSRRRGTRFLLRYQARHRGSSGHSRWRRAGPTQPRTRSGDTSNNYPTHRWSACQWPGFRLRSSRRCGRESTLVCGRNRDGNEAAAYVAHKTNEVCAIYPITPRRTWASGPTNGRPLGATEHLGHRPTVVEMQSEAGAAGAVHGALAGGRADHHLHGLAGPAADDPQHVQDRRRADLDGHSTSRPAPWPPTRCRSSATTAT